jgi:hypothetical protein
MLRISTLTLLTLLIIPGVKAQLTNPGVESVATGSCSGISPGPETSKGPQVSQATIVSPLKDHNKRTVFTGQAEIIL